MRVNGIIAEYNPFHNGHLYQMEESRRLTGADYTVAAMSGNFVQRGAPALLDKHVRAEAALQCGADLVLEIPVLYATASSEYFAAGAVALLDRLGVVTHLSFGSECGDLGALRQVAEVLAEEPEAYRASLRKLLRQGVSYPAARIRALAEVCSLAGGGEILSGPNDILGADYLKALFLRGSAITPVTVRREGAGHHDGLPEESGGGSPRFASASALRQELRENGDLARLCPYLPEAVRQILCGSLSRVKPLCADDFSAILYYKLLLEKESGYTKYLDVSRELSDRIRNRLYEFTGFEAFCDLLKTKEVTYARISRCMTHILLGIAKEHMERGRAMDYVPYARVLGFRRTAIPLLHRIKERAAVPLVTGPADAWRCLSPEACRLLGQDILAGDIYRGVSVGRSHECLPNEFTRRPVIL